MGFSRNGRRMPGDFFFWAEEVYCNGGGEWKWFWDSNYMFEYEFINRRTSTEYFDNKLLEVILKNSDDIKLCSLRGSEFNISLYLCNLSSKYT